MNIHLQISLKIWNYKPLKENIEENTYGIAGQWNFGYVYIIGMSFMSPNALLKSQIIPKHPYTYI